MRGLLGLRKWARRLRRRVLILLYHRIADLPSDPQLLCVTPRHFAEHLDLLRGKYHLLSLQRLCRGQQFKLWQPPSVSVTFDDGYADNLHQAKPLLERFDVPATVFVVADQIGSNREYWWDDLARILITSRALPRSLELTLAGMTYTWHLDKETKEDNCIIDGWNVLMEAPPTSCYSAYREIASLLRQLDNVSRERILGELSEWAGLDRIGRQEYRALDPDELRAIVLGRLVEVGAHTMTHTRLSILPATAQLAEIADSKRRLEELLGQAVTSLSYPFGGQSDCDAGTAKLVQEAGFARACSNSPGFVQWDTDRYQLPRFLVRDWDGDEFERHIKEWFGY